MANVSYYRSTVGRRGPSLGRGGGATGLPRRSRRGPIAAVAALVVVLGVVAAAALILVSAKASLTTDPVALARVGMPLGGGKIESVVVIQAPDNRPVPVTLRGDQIFPNKLIPAGRRVTIDVTVRRPGWISWLSGKRQHLELTLVTPVTSLKNHYLTVGPGAPLRLRFAAPISTISYGALGHLRRLDLPSPVSEYSIPQTAAAGTMSVAAAPRTWETSPASLVSWFPTGSATAATANPAPGSSILPSTPIYLTFSKPVKQALAGHLPPVLPITPGTWHSVNTHTIEFIPTGYGYGMGATVNIPLPAGVRLVGGAPTWKVPPGSTLRLQQLLSLLGYLPFHVNYAHGGVGLSPQAQENAAVNPPKASFDWAYPNVPSQLRSEWAPGVSGEMTKGAVMAFENDHGMTPDGDAGPTVWKSLISAVVLGHRSAFGYTYVMVSEGSPESIDVWHNGKSVVTGPVNTGIPQAPTAQGTFAVFEHAPSVTMSGTNPDGSHYSDPGVPYVSYFNGGDALHGFLRASYGSAQSLGCVEMPYSEAAAVYPYTPVGTLVNVS